MSRLSRRFSWLGAATALAILAGLFLLLYLVIIPWIGEVVAGRISKDWEMSVGEQMHSAMMETYEVDQHRTGTINEFYRATGFNIAYPVKITVVKDAQLNAFALPGGFIVVNDGLINRLSSHSELAALLGHEASHISERHSLRNMFRTLSRKMFLSLIIGNSSGMAAVIVDQADALKGLQYSRRLETEADDHGLELMARHGIDPHGMLSLMQLLQEETKGKEPSALLSTHPVFEDRISNIRRQIGSISASPNKQQTLSGIFRSLKQHSSY